MATLSSNDLRIRLVLQPRAYQFDDADNLYDLNWVTVNARIVFGGRPGQVMRTRLATWELQTIVAQCDLLARGQSSLWQPKFFDSGVHLWLRRSLDRGEYFDVAALLSSVSGPLPADTPKLWIGPQLHHPDGNLEGARYSCSRSALGLFVEELRESMVDFPLRPLKTA